MSTQPLDSGYQMFLFLIVIQHYLQGPLVVQIKPLHLYLYLPSIVLHSCIVMLAPILLPYYCTSIACAL